MVFRVTYIDIAFCRRCQLQKKNICVLSIQMIDGKYSTVAAAAAVVAAVATAAVAAAATAAV